MGAKSNGEFMGAPPITFYGGVTMGTLGKMIGVVEDNFEVTNSREQKVKLTVKFDFTTASDADVKSWLCGNRRIAFQRPARSLSVDELKALSGKTVIAQNAGQKVKSAEEIEKEAMNAFSAMSDEQKAAYIERLKAIAEGRETE